MRTTTCATYAWECHAQLCDLLSSPVRINPHTCVWHALHYADTLFSGLLFVTRIFPVLSTPNKRDNPSKPCSLHTSITIATVMSEAIIFFLIWTDVPLFNSLYNFMSEKHFLGTDVTICATVHLCAHEQTRRDVARSSTTVVNLRV